MTLKVILVRHGETDSNVHHVLQGSLNTPLNANGKSQARQTGLNLKNVHIDRAFCSSLERCVQTAEPIVSGRVLRTSYTKEIWEKDLGVLEGMQYQDATRKMKQEGKILDDYGEGQKAFAARLLAFWDSSILPFVAEAKEKSETILIVTHGGCIATLARELAARGYEPAPGHSGNYMVPRSKIQSWSGTFANPSSDCSITEVDINLDGDYTGRFVRMGDHAHIREFHEDIVGVDAQIGKPSSGIDNQSSA